MSAGETNIHDRLSKTKIGNRRAPIRRTRSRSVDQLPEIDPIASAKITKQFALLQEAYQASPPLTPSLKPPNGERRRSLLKKPSQDDIIVGTSSRPRSTIRPTAPSSQTIDSTRPHTQPSRRLIQRVLSKDDHDLPTEKSIMFPQPPPMPLQAPSSGRRASQAPLRVLKRGQSKDDSELQNTVHLTASAHRSPRKQWVAGKTPSVENAPSDSPLLLCERPKLFWRQRISTSFLIYHHILSPLPTQDPPPSSPLRPVPPSSSSSSSSPPPSSSSSSNDFSSSYFEIIPTDVEKKGLTFDRIYVSVATLMQMKAKEFNAIIEARPRSITTKPYASKEEIQRVNQIKKEEKFKMLIETCADYCAENLDISLEESNEKHISLILRRYHGL
jgi:hypothetical protein